MGLENELIGRQHVCVKRQKIHRPITLQGPVLGVFVRAERRDKHARALVVPVDVVLNLVAQFGLVSYVALLVGGLNCLPGPDGSSHFVTFSDHPLSGLRPGVLNKVELLR